MTHLEKLTLYLRVRNRSSFVNGTHLHNEILVHMPQLHTFIFYISTENNINESVHRISNDDIQQTFTHTRYARTGCMVNYLNTFKAICHVFSLPFTFTRLNMITNQFPTIIFDYVTHLHVFDVVSLKHEFFIRISRAFPMLQFFSLVNIMFQSWDVNEWQYDNNSTFLQLLNILILYHLTSRAHLPRLAELKVSYDQLKMVTMNFTRDATRRNCSKVKRLIVEESTVFSKDVYQYFPSL
ncbi:unnamed protein product [Rotaria socialis]|uniref:Uncharacterized protein n=1 Tax=Rotaria socialis TaxID=392032 RepID=A0A820P2J1_9BILA|nr:unnamed protein product [Rotaria socialis]